MYAGEVVEEADLRELFRDPLHPYTWGLLRSAPRLDQSRTERLIGVPGQPIQGATAIPGCKFEPRCPVRVERCAREEPPLDAVGPGRVARCWVLMRNAREAA